VDVGQIIILVYLTNKFASRAVDFVHNITVHQIIRPLSGWCTRQFRDAGAAVLEEVAADFPVRGGTGERQPIIRAAHRYGPPPGSTSVAHGPALPAADPNKPSTLAFVGRMMHRPNMDS
jgi:hypothetical protein